MNWLQESDWQDITLAEVPGLSRLLLFYRSDLLDPNDVASVFSLASIVFLIDRTYLERFQLPPLPPGWNEFGLSGYLGEERQQGERYRLGAQVWSLFFSWHGSYSAGEALLQTQDMLSSQGPFLLPPLLLPCLVLVRMADLYKAQGNTRAAARWVECIVKAEIRLSRLITAFYLHWMTGTGESAWLAASRLEAHPELAFDQSLALNRWERIFGGELLDVLHVTDRVESTIIRGLEAASTRLWTDHSLAIPGQLLHFVSALLPLARWRPEPVGPAILETENLGSLNALLNAWKAWRAGGA